MLCSVIGRPLLLLWRLAFVVFVVVSDRQKGEYLMSVHANDAASLYEACSSASHVRYHQFRLTRRFHNLTSFLISPYSHWLCRSDQHHRNVLTRSYPSRCIRRHLIRRMGIPNLWRSVALQASMGLQEWSRGDYSCECESVL